MRNKKIESKKTSNEEKMGFFQKFREDKKYNAKIQLLGYGILILLIIIFLNISGMNNNSTYSSNSINDSGKTNDEDVVDEDIVDITLLENITNNYEYDVNVSLTKTNEEVVSYRYYGKGYGNNIIINKEFNNMTNVYYNVDGYYYIKNEVNEFGLISDEQIYDLVEGKYIELVDVLKFIDKANLEHVVDSSNGAKESVYNLLIRDVVISNKTDDVVSINVIELDGKLSISIDYTNLMKVFDNTIQSCKIDYVYTNIDGVEEFSVIDKEIVE